MFLIFFLKEMLFIVLKVEYFVLGCFFKYGKFVLCIRFWVIDVNVC